MRLSSEVLAPAMHAENPLHAGIDGKGAAVDDKTDSDRRLNCTLGIPIIWKSAALFLHQARLAGCLEFGGVDRAVLIDISLNEIRDMDLGLFGVN